MANRHYQENGNSLNRRAVLRTVGGAVTGGALIAGTASASHPTIDLNIFQTVKLTYWDYRARNRFKYAHTLKNLFERVVPFSEARTNVTVVETPINAYDVDFADSPSPGATVGPLLEETGPTAEDANLLLTTEGGGRAGERFAWAPAMRDDMKTISGSIADFDPASDPLIGSQFSDKYNLARHELHEIGHTLIGFAGSEYEGGDPDPCGDNLSWDHTVGWYGYEDGQLVHTPMAGNESCYGAGKNWCGNSVDPDSSASIYLRYSDCFWDLLDVD